MRRKLRTSQVLAGLAVGALTLGACGGGEADGNDGQDGGDGAAPAAVEGGHATYALDTPTGEIFDPNAAAAAQGARVFRQLFDSLTYMDENREVQPWLATDWDISEDGTEYTFTLRDDVTFHDGEPFNAEAVCFNFDRIMAPETASVFAIGLMGPYESCEAPDETTAVVQLATPYAPFLNNLSSPFAGINSPAAVEAAASNEDYNVAPVGTGPFVLDSFTPGDRVELVRNEDYAWAPANADHEGPALLERLTLQVIPDSTVRLGSVRSGDIQGMGGVPNNEAAAIEADPTLQFITQPQSGSPFQLNFNSGKAPFDDVDVRKAARAAMDIESAVSALYFGVNERAWGPLAPTTLSYDPSIEGSFEFDPEEAAALLDEAGWTMGPDGVREKDGERLAITYVESTPNRELRQDVATFLEANLEEVGFDVEVSLQQAAPLQSVIQEGTYDMLGLSLVNVDPNVLYQLYDSRFHPSPDRIAFNFTKTDDPELDALLAEGQASQDQAERDEIYAQVQQNVVENARSVGVYVPAYSLALNGLEGIRFDSEGYPIFYDAFLAQ